MTTKHLNSCEQFQLFPPIEESHWEKWQSVSESFSSRISERFAAESVMSKPDITTRRWRQNESEKIHVEFCRQVLWSIRTLRTKSVLYILVNLTLNFFYVMLTWTWNSDFEPILSPLESQWMRSQLWQFRSFVLNVTHHFRCLKIASTQG